MYFRASEEESVCSFCDHPIAAGSLCLSLAPITEQDVESAEPAEFAVLHPECDDCESDESCFVSYASRQSPTEAHEDGACAYCQHGIQVGQPVFEETILVVEEEAATDATKVMDIRDVAGKVGTSFVGVRRLGTLTAGRFSGLTLQLKHKFMSAGLGGGRGTRTLSQAQQMYQATVPRFVRNLGKTKEFIKGKDASHIESVANAPHKAKSATNIIWESTKANVKRGSQNMNRLERLAVNAKNGASASKIVAKAAAANATRGAFFAAALEAPASAVENVIHFRKGRKSKEDAAKSVAKDTATAGAAGAAAGVGVTAVVVLGAGAVLAPLTVPVMIAGTGLYAFATFRRIQKAMTEGADTETPPDVANAILQFHVECPECESGELCHDGFLRFLLASAA